MENFELNRDFVIKEVELEKPFMELLDLIQLVKGFYRSSEVLEYLTENSPTESEYSDSVINGFETALRMFDEKAEILLKSIYDSHKILSNTKKEGTITPKELGLKPGGRQKKTVQLA